MRTARWIWAIVCLAPTFAFATGGVDTNSTKTFMQSADGQFVYDLPGDGSNPISVDKLNACFTSGNCTSTKAANAKRIYNYPIPCTGSGGASCTGCWKRSGQAFQRVSDLDSAGNCPATVNGASSGYYKVFVGYQTECPGGAANCTNGRIMLGCSINKVSASASGGDSLVGYNKECFGGSPIIVDPTNSAAYTIAMSTVIPSSTPAACTPTQTCADLAPLTCKGSTYYDSCGTACAATGAEIDCAKVQPTSCPTPDVSQMCTTLSFTDACGKNYTGTKDCGQAKDVCSAGQYGTYPNCTACPSGTYKSASGNAGSCTACSTTSIANATGLSYTSQSGSTAATACFVNYACSSGTPQSNPAQYNGTGYSGASCTPAAGDAGLVYGNHTSQDCTDMGGTVASVDLGGASALICKFSNLNGSITGKPPGSALAPATVDICRYKDGFSYPDGTTGPYADNSYTPAGSSDPYNNPTFADFWTYACTGHGYNRGCPTIANATSAKNKWTQYKGYGTWVARKALRLPVTIIHGPAQCASAVAGIPSCAPGYVNGSDAFYKCQFNESTGTFGDNPNQPSIATDIKYEYKRVNVQVPYSFCGAGYVLDSDGCCTSPSGQSSCEYRCVANTTYSSNSSSNLDEIGCY